MFRIYFSDIGINKWTGDIKVSVENLEDAENAALFECRKHLESNFISLEHTGAMVYDVTASFETIGQIMIRSI